MSHITEQLLLKSALSPELARLLDITPENLEIALAQATLIGERNRVTLTEALQQQVTHKEESVSTTFEVEGVVVTVPTGPAERHLTKSERHAINSALTKCGQETLGSSPDVALGQRACVALQNRVSLGKAEGKVERVGKHRKPGPGKDPGDYIGKHRKAKKVAVYVAVDKPLVWNDKPVSQAQYDWYNRGSKTPVVSDERPDDEAFARQVAEVTAAVLALL